MASRDARFDGRFVVAVTSTRVYCRPSCPSRTPKPENTRFFGLPAAAESAGFRACRRCRPDAAPASPEWNVRGDLAARALRLIAGGAVDKDGVAGLARRLAVSGRHLHRQLMAEVGAGPQALALHRRARTARLLIESSDLPLADVAFAAGYASVRQFNEGIRAAFGCPPGGLRRGRTTAAPSEGGELVLHVPYRAPLAVGALLDLLAADALPGVEEVTDRMYRRTLRAGEAVVSFPDPLDTPAATLRLSLDDLRDVGTAVQRCRELFDLDADPATIDAALGSLAHARPGLRVPGCADGFELAVRTVLGRARSAEFAAREGGIPDAETLSIHAGDATVRALARAVCDGALSLDRGADREATTEALRAIPGISPWAVATIAMRALGDPDAFPADDPRLRRAARRLGIAADKSELIGYAERWRPWRSYATMHLWAESE
ncbi:DNA-3-methyladenine glycosylase 2 family protein [Micromonospora sp. CPCC 206061]|uniref:DNA-3-methyladenine glycosylase 2 family protein n=1 Tax=Micromonospora sp. CPCC 206061 TaxID=3122410 RepID=UPI002FEEED68